MRYLIVLEQTEAGFAVQVPDLAIVTFGETIQQAKRTAIEAIQSNLEAYQEVGKGVPMKQPASTHWNNPDFADMLFTHIDVETPILLETVAA